LLEGKPGGGRKKKKKKKKKEKKRKKEKKSHVGGRYFKTASYLGDPRISEWGLEKRTAALTIYEQLRSREKRWVAARKKKNKTTPPLHRL